ncbi:hypothetical protein EW146_g5755 [Bondarzewia mesenterica]|uniref:Prefoldin subunit 4 n=1 Tax=Bondarzewia mesenterica TaxID=1095465 RepID=A0A4S4LQG5_9AGAM|nr:hypothetical protein EW146_g5755 [Bondarzewia mesenterica]
MSAAVEVAAGMTWRFAAVPLHSDHKKRLRRHKSRLVQQSAILEFLQPLLTGHKFTKTVEMRMLAQEEENDEGTDVTWGAFAIISFCQSPKIRSKRAEDQQRINAFSKLNTRMRSIEERREELKQEKEALDDLSMELELADEDEPVLYKVGEAFLRMPHSRASKRLKHDQEQLEKELSALDARAEVCEKDMKDLKVTLYAKFGRAINLDE